MFCVMCLLGSIPDVLSIVPDAIYKIWPIAAAERKYNHPQYDYDEHITLDVGFEVPNRYCPTMSLPLAPKTLTWRTRENGRQVVLWAKGLKVQQPTYTIGPLNFTAFFTAQQPQHCNEYLEWLRIVHRQYVDPSEHRKYVRLD